MCLHIQYLFSCTGFIWKHFFDFHWLLINQKPPLIYLLITDHVYIFSMRLLCAVSLSWINYSGLTCPVICQKLHFVPYLLHLESVYTLIWGVAFGNGTIHNSGGPGIHFMKCCSFIYSFSILGARWERLPDH